MSGQVRVWCLRHAESEANAKAPGAAEDCGLTALGRRQAIAAAQLLAAEPITRIFCSTALRARQTAEMLAPAPAAPPGLPVIAMPELVEVGVSADVLRAWVVEQDLDQRAADGETGHQVVARVTAAIQQIADAHPGETGAVVGHVASLTVALAQFCALGAAVWGAPLPHARPFLVEWDGQTWRCLAWPGEVEQPLGMSSTLHSSLCFRTSFNTLATPGPSGGSGLTVGPQAQALGREAPGR